jgi:hypothetical protein
MSAVVIRPREVLGVQHGAGVVNPTASATSLPTRMEIVLENACRWMTEFPT